MDETRQIDVTRNQPILVTGAHRSGTTWVGKMLNASGETAYISEPLNVLHRPGVLHTSVSAWYTYICEENEADFLPAFRQTLGYKYSLGAELASLRNIKDALRMGRDLGIFIEGMMLHQRPLLKDPFAVFSLPWFISRLGCQVVVSIRHPGAFVSSLKRLGWNFDYRDLLDQQLLMRDWLGLYCDDMESVADSSPDIIEQGSLLWRIVYQTVWQMKEKLPQVLLVRHEDLSLNPLDGFRNLYESLSLRFSAKAQSEILASSNSENPQELGRKAHSVRLDSRMNLHNWKRRLTDDEIDRVIKLTHETASLFYSPEEWE